MNLFDTHTHAISSDTVTYPPAPLGGTRSEWSQTRPVDADGLIRALDDAGVARAALVHASTVYGFDSSYAADALARYPDRLVGVCAVDFLSENAVADLRHWIEDRNFAGVRIRVSDGTTKVPTPGAGVSDERMAKVWEYIADKSVPACIQMHSKDTDKLLQVLGNHPGLTVLLDHMGRPDATGGSPYPHLDQLGRLSAFEGLHLKITPPALKRLDDQPCVDTVEVLQRLAEIFGTDRLMWGSNYPASEGSLTNIHAAIRRRLTWLTDSELADVLGGNAARIYGTTTHGR